MITPLVSIITPTFNHEKYIFQCINSVLAQSYSNWEMIIIDDYSHDSTFDIINSVAKKDSRIILRRHKKNYGGLGLSKTYNEALSIARGELIAILEGDDYWSNRKLQTQVQVFRDKDVILSYADYDEIDSNGNAIASRKYRVSGKFLKSNMLQNILFFSKLNNFAANTVMIRKNALEKSCGFVDANIPLVDYPTYLKLTLEGSFYRIPDTLGFWRRHHNSIFFKNRAIIMQKSADYFREFIRRHEKHMIKNNISFEKMLGNVEYAAQWHEATAPFFEGKYQLLFGENKEARDKFIGVFKSRNIPLKYKIGAHIGFVSSYFPSKYYINSNKFFTYCFAFLKAFNRSS